MTDMSKIKQVHSEYMEVVSYGEDADLKLRDLGHKEHREFKYKYHDFRVTPFQENLKLLKPGKIVEVTITIRED